MDSLRSVGLAQEAAGAVSLDGIVEGAFGSDGSHPSDAIPLKTENPHCEKA
jgi:hypothetical protein